MNTSVRPSVAAVAAFAASIASAACTLGTIGTTRPSPPASNAEATQTESFTGTLGPNGSEIHTFAISHVGAITATLSSVVPASPLGFVLGSYDGTACRPRVENDNAGPGQPLSGTPVSVGTFCVRVFDPGLLAAGATVDYAVTVTHP